MVSTAVRPRDLKIGCVFLFNATRAEIFDMRDRKPASATEKQ